MQSAEALGTTVELRLRGVAGKELEQTFAQLWKRVGSFEQTLSRFIPLSELSRFNARAGEKVPVGNLFREVLLASQRASVLSSGLFNPFILPALIRAGYRTSLTHNKVDEVQDVSLRNIATPEMLEVGEGWACIPKDTAIDVGGIGKGFLADKLSVALEEMYPNHLLSLGGDMKVEGSEDGKGASWEIEIESHENVAEAVARVTPPCKKYGVATSGVLRKKQKGVQAHQIDPRTQKPIAASLQRVSILAPDCVTADTMASSVLLGGRSLAESLLTSKSIYGALLQYEGEDLVILGTGFSLLQ